MLIIGKPAKSIVSSNFKMSLLPDNPTLRLHFKLLKGSIHHWKASWICAPHLGIIMCFWWWENLFQLKVAVGTMHMHQGARCAKGLLGMINDEKKH